MNSSAAKVSNSCVDSSVTAEFVAAGFDPPTEDYKHPSSLGRVGAKLGIGPAGCYNLLLLDSACHCHSVETRICFEQSKGCLSFDGF